MGDERTISVLRRSDMAAVDITLVNLTRTEHADGSADLVLTDPNQAAQLRIRFAPQAILEQVFIGDGRLRPAPLADALFSGTSELVLRVPPSATPFPLTAAGLLSWVGLIGVPADSTLECIFGLLLRPAFWPNDVWVNATDAVESPRSGAYGLWHTTLMVRDGRGAPEFTRRTPMPVVADVSAIAEPSNGFEIPLAPGTCGRIARSSDALPLLARQLTLSPLGATVDLSGHWPSGVGFDGLVAYQHRAVLGRDHSVETVTRGYLLPFGFPAVLTEFTERAGHVRSIDSNHDGAAFLVKSVKVSVIDPVAVYPDAPGLPDQGRGFPFRAVHLHAPLTADVKTLEDSVTTGVTWINRPGSDTSAAARHLFDLSAEDHAGNVVSFSAPMYFVNADTAVTPGGAVGTAARIYDSEQRGLARSAPGRIALAIAAPQESLVDTVALYIGAEPAGPDAVAGARLAAFPRLAGVDARIPAIDAFAAGRPPAAGAGPQLVLAPNYLRSGFGPSGVYAQLNRPQGFLPPAGGAGGLANLNVNVVGLSRSCGLVGGATAAAAEALDAGFKPEQFFPQIVPDATGYLPPKLLGFIDLAAIVAPAPAGDRDKVPKVATEVITEPGPGGVPVPTQVRSTVSWRPAVRPDSTSGILRTRDQTALEIHCVTTVELHGGSPITDVRGELRGFDLEFLDGVLTVVFDRVTFASHAGAPPALDAKIKAITPFAGQAEKGALAFFSDLLELLPNVPDGPRILHSANSITAEYAIALPSASMGVFMMQDLAVVASVTVPLDGHPVRARFAISSREHPFLLTVSLFGGGGFLALEVEGTEVKQLEAQLEFAAATSLDLIVASASVAVTAGIYLRFDNGAVHVEGFFRAVGELDVLGLVNVSVEIYLALSFVSGPPKRFTGRAEITVRVRVLFFAQSLTIAVERSFGGGDDPPFDATFPTPDPWLEHCAAFAPMVGP